MGSWAHSENPGMHTWKQAGRKKSQEEPIVSADHSTTRTLASETVKYVLWGFVTAIQAT